MVISVRKHGTFYDFDQEELKELRNLLEDRVKQFDHCVNDCDTQGVIDLFLTSIFCDVEGPDSIREFFENHQNKK